MKKDKVFGVLALQGSFIEHYNCLKKLTDNVLLVKNKEDLNKIDALIIPGGESTAIKKLLLAFDLFTDLENKIKNGLYVLGTCAGLILLAEKIENENKHLGGLNVLVRRNAFGSQLNSFIVESEIKLNEKNEKIEMVFIRAPYILEVNDSVEVLAKFDGKIVAVKENKIIGLAFHPELTSDLTIYKYFLEMVNKEN